MIRLKHRPGAQKETAGGKLSDVMVTVLDPANPASEAYRALRSRLLCAPVDISSKVIVVTGPGDGAGKSILASNLAVVLARAGKNVLLADCDFRDPAAHEIFGLTGTPGVADVLTGTHELHEVCQQPLPELSLKVLAAGSISPAPMEFLLPDRMVEFLTSARKEFDYVLIDSSSAGLVSDSEALAMHSDGVLLALDPRKRSKEDAFQLVQELRGLGVNILGTVMNYVKDSGKRRRGSSR